jgi:hypothetical protein
MFAGLSLALRGHALPAAALLAVAITVKIVPAMTLPVFAVTRHFRFLGLVTIITVALNVLPSIYFGVSDNQDLITRWYEHVVVNQEFHDTNGPINLSFKGQLRRTFTEVDYTKRVDGDHRYAAVNVAALSPSTCDRVWISISACVFLAGLVLIWMSARTRDTATHEVTDLRVAALQIGLLICLMLFVGPLTSRVYLVALLWPVVAVGVAAWDHTVIRRALIVTAIASSALPLLPGRSLQRLLLVVGTDFYVSTAMLGLVAFTLVRVSGLRTSREQR